MSPGRACGIYFLSCLFWIKVKVDLVFSWSRIQIRIKTFVLLQEPNLGEGRFLYLAKTTTEKQRSPVDVEKANNICSCSYPSFASIFLIETMIELRLKITFIYLISLNRESYESGRPTSVGQPDLTRSRICCIIFHCSVLTRWDSSELCWWSPVCLTSAQKDSVNIGSFYNVKLTSIST